MEQDMTLGKKLSFYRKNYGITQAELAERLNLSAQAISKWENDSSQPDFENLIKLARLYKVTTDELLGLGAPKEQPPQQVDPAPVIEASITKIEEQIKNEAPIGYCKSCGIAVKEDNLAQKEPVILCKKCKKKIEDEKIAAAKSANEKRERERQKEILRHECEMDSMRRHRNKSLIWAAVAALPLLIYCIVGLFQDMKAASIIALLVLDVLVYTFVAVMFYDTFVKDAVIYMLTSSVNWPGLIFTFDLDGLLWLIGMKILFAVLGFIIGILAAILGLAFGLLVSPFVFVFILIRYNYKIAHGIYEDPELE